MEKKQTEITAPQRLLQGGDIAQPGFAKKLHWQYDRADITAPAWRIKEWDCYVLGNQDIGMSLVVSDSGYVANVGANLFDYNTGVVEGKSVISLFPMGSWNMPATTDSGHAEGRIGNFRMGFYNNGKKRVLRGQVPRFGSKKAPLRIDLTLTDTPEESMVIATPLGKPGHFYYNQKINCMRVRGTVTWGDAVYTFDPSDSFATLDWGRGVWTYDNTWFWSSMNTALPDGSVFGWNLGHGFGDTSAATENMLFHNGKAHKLAEVDFRPPVINGREEFMSPWQVTSSDGRIEMIFEPVLDHSVPVNLGVIAMLGNQIFGKFTGKAILDDGTVIEIKERLGFCEKFHNKW